MEKFKRWAVKHCTLLSILSLILCFVISFIIGVVLVNTGNVYVLIAIAPVGLFYAWFNSALNEWQEEYMGVEILDVIKLSIANTIKECEDDKDA